MRCGADTDLEVVALPRALDAEQAMHAYRSWLKRSPCVPVEVARVRLQALEVPCDHTGRVLGAVRTAQLAVDGEVEPVEEEVELDIVRSGPLERVVMVPVWRATIEPEVLIHGHSGDVLGQVPIDHDRLRRRVLTGLVGTALVAICVGTPMLPMLGSGLLVWGVALLAIVGQQRRWRRAEQGMGR